VVAPAVLLALVEVVPTVVAADIACVVALVVPLVYATAVEEEEHEVETVTGTVVTAEETVHGQSVMVMVSLAVAV